MSREITLLTSLSTFVKLHEKASTPRAVAVRVDIADLGQLLIDHTTLVNACKASGIRVIEPPGRKRAELKNA